MISKKTESSLITAFLPRYIEKKSDFQKTESLLITAFLPRYIEKKVICWHKILKLVGKETAAILFLRKTTNKEKLEVKLDSIQIKVVKRVMELPYATPSAAVSYEFGFLDLSLVIKLEKVLFAVKTMKSPDERKAKQLLKVMLEKKDPGFATEVLEISSSVFGMDL